MQRLPASSVLPSVVLLPLLAPSSSSLEDAVERRHSWFLHFSLSPHPKPCWGGLGVKLWRRAMGARALALGTWETGGAEGPGAALGQKRVLSRPGPAQA